MEKSQEKDQQKVLDAPGLKPRASHQPGDTSPVEEYGSLSRTDRDQYSLFGWIKMMRYWIGEFIWRRRFWHKTRQDSET